MFSSVDMTPIFDVTPSTPEIKPGFSKVKEYILTWHADWLNFKIILGYRMRFKIILGLVKPGV